jgi:hybrid cluster-associated redox disulfide protein
MKITKKTKLSEVMGNEKAVEILFESGLSCMGCPMAMQETIEEGCMSHGMKSKEIDKLIEKLNKK